MNMASELLNNALRKVMDVLTEHATDRDMVFAGHCRLRVVNDKVLPLINKFVPENPDGIFPEFTLSAAISFLRESYSQRESCTSLLAMLLNNVEIGRDKRSQSGEPDFRRKEAESVLCNYLLDRREEWVLNGVPRSALAWFSIGQELLPFALESHYRSLMDRSVGTLAHKNDHVILEQRDAGKFYYYQPDASRRYLITSFPASEAEISEIPSSAVVCHGTGCAGEVAILLREADRYKIRGENSRYEPKTVFNLAPMICFEPVNIGTELAYDIFRVPFKTVNIFLDPECSHVQVKVRVP